MLLGRHTVLFKEKAGIIGEDPLWVIIHKEYLYLSGSLLGVLWDAYKNWNKDNSVVG
jgi:hypothetical protein